jgi:citrate lyase subunit beta/citryl-CoA lyase
VAFGAADYALDLNIERTKEGVELDYPRAKIPIACRAAKVAPPIDTPYMLDLKDLDALIKEAGKAKNWGYQGKLVIHPNQIEPCNKIFSPSDEEIQKARRIVEAFEKAELEKLAAMQLDGQFIDYAIFERSKQVLEIAELIQKH